MTDPVEIEAELGDQPKRLPTEEPNPSRPAIQVRSAPAGPVING
jgi:hypothetical protein